MYILPDCLAILLSSSPPRARHSGCPTWAMQADFQGIWVLDGWRIYRSTMVSKLFWGIYCDGWLQHVISVGSFDCIWWNKEPNAICDTSKSILFEDQSQHYCFMMSWMSRPGTVQLSQWISRHAVVIRRRLTCCFLWVIGKMHLIVQQTHAVCRGWLRLEAFCRNMGCPLDSKQLSAPFVKFKGIGPKSRFGVIRVLRRPRVALRNGLVAMIQPVMIACGRET